jgi:hypothetical protein
MTTKKKKKKRKRRGRTTRTRRTTTRTRRRRKKKKKKKKKKHTTISYRNGSHGGYEGHRPLFCDVAYCWYVSGEIPASIFRDSLLHVM